MVNLEGNNIGPLFPIELLEEVIGRVWVPAGWPVS